jgi:hypothetical protein
MYGQQHETHSSEPNSTAPVCRHAMAEKPVQPATAGDHAHTYTLPTNNGFCTMEKKPRPTKRADPLLVEVAGGGPVGLVFSSLLRTLMGDQIRVRVYDSRWCRQDGRVVWRDWEDGNNRRRQVVTLQSNVWAALPKRVKESLFVEGNYSEMWPLGPDSPASKGRPRNIRIRWIEDCLLELAQDAYGIELVPGAYVIPETWKDPHVLAICDGPQSMTRQSLRSHFGTPSRELYSINGSPLEETVLGLEVQSDLPDEYTVPLTVCQNWSLFNPLDGRGFINMRLTPEEAAEVIGITEHGPASCIQRHPCVMRRGAGGFACDTHRAIFKPSVDPYSFLWPRIQDGLRYFGVAPQNLLGITAFRLGMEHLPKFTAQLAPGTFGALLGDAACSLHFWPGRGLNTGLKSALSLARCLQSCWQGKPLRTADFDRHEGLMHRLQFREKSRAWTMMVMPDQNGDPQPIAERIRAGLKPPFDRQALRAKLWARMSSIRARLSGRMGPLPEDDWFLQTLYGLNDETLNVMDIPYAAMSETSSNC